MKNENGQALLIVVLVMVVALTVALSVASRSITNLRIATDQENSQAAFSAAEAGIEQILKGVAPQINQELGKANIKETAITPVEGKEIALNNGAPVPKDIGTDVWLIDHNADGTLNYNSGWHADSFSGEKKITVYWGKTSDECSLSSNPDTIAAIEIVVMSGANISPKVTRYAIDPCEDRRVINSFIPEDQESAFIRTEKRITYKYMKEIIINTPSSGSKGILLRIIPLYADTPVAIRGCIDSVPDPTKGSACTPFPIQGRVIDSTGTSGETVRKITYFQKYSELPPEFFQYVLFSSQQ